MPHLAPFNWTLFFILFNFYMSFYMIIQYWWIPHFNYTHFIFKTHLMKALKTQIKLPQSVGK